MTHRRAPFPFPLALALLGTAACAGGERSLSGDVVPSADAARGAPASTTPRSDASSANESLVRVGAFRSAPDGSGEVAVALRASAVDSVAGIEVVLTHDPSRVSYLGPQIADRPTALVLDHPEDGRVRVVGAGLGVPLGADALVLRFRELASGGAASIRLASAGARVALASGDERPVRIAAGAPVVDPALRVGVAERLTAAEWATRLGLADEARGTRALSLPTGRIYGDANGTGTVTVGDVVIAANTTVGNITPTPTQFEALNVAPTNTLDGVEVGLPDPCRPGRACTAGAPYGETGPGAVTVGDVVLLANKTVGNTVPVVGLSIPAPAGQVSGTVTSPERGALSGVTVTMNPGTATTPSGTTSATTSGIGAFGPVVVPVGSVTLTLSGLPAGCTDPGPTMVSVTADVASTQTVAVSCAPGSGFGAAAFLADVDLATEQIVITSPGGVPGLLLNTRASLAPGRPAVSASLLGSDAVRITTSNFFASAVGAVVPGKVRVTFLVRVENRFPTIALVTPTFPDPPPGQLGVLLIPYSANPLVTSGGTVVEVSTPGAVVPSVDWNGNGVPDAPAFPAAPGGGGDPFSFFNDVTCAAPPAPATSDCFRYETYGVIGAGAISIARRVGFDVDPSVGQFRARLIAVADLAPVP